MNAKTINLQEWEAFGGGGFGTSYYNKTDDSVILKLNSQAYPKTLPEKNSCAPRRLYGTRYYRSGMNTNLIPQQGRWFIGSVGIRL